MQNEYNSLFNVDEQARTDCDKLNALKMTYVRYFHFQGYSSRREFLWNLFGLGLPILFLLFIFLLNFYGVMILLILFLLFSFFPIFALLSRRFADAGLPRLAIMPIFLVFVPIPLYIQITAVVAVLLPTFLPTKHR